jgi:hypothetical protein
MSLSLRIQIVVSAWLFAMVGAQPAFAQVGSSGPAAPRDPSDPTLPSPYPSAAPMAVPRPAPDGRFHAYLNDGSHLIGKLDIGEKLTLESALGRVEVPPAEIVAIDFSQDKAIVRFRNGDQLTGALPLMNLKLTTLWGQAEIELRHLQTIISHEQFVQSSMSPDGSPATWAPAGTMMPGYRGGYSDGPYSAPTPYYPSPSAPVPVPAPIPPMITPPASGAR